MTPSEHGPSAALAEQRPGLRARQLGYAGLLPFVIGAALIWIVRADAQDHASTALSAYAAVILSFLGGIHWGFGIQRRQGQAAHFVWAVVPALMASIAVLMPPRAGLVIHALMLVICYLVDRKLYPAQQAAGWLTLRFRLTVIASLSCFLGAAGA